MTAICPRDPGNRDLRGVRVLDYRAAAETGSRIGFVREYLWSLLMAGGLTVRALFSGGFDVVSVSSTPDIFFLVAAPLRLLGKKVVFDLKDLSPEIYAARYGRADGPVYRMLRILERASMRTAHRVLVVNESLRRVAVTRGGVPPDRVTIIRNGPTLAQAGRRQVRPGLRRGRAHLACLVGMMGPQDSVDLAVRAVGHLVNHVGRTDCAFAFVGVGDAVPECRRLARELGVDAWVSFPGWAEPDLAFAYMCTADVGLEPNLEEFVSPVKVMEYMAFGLPVVAFDVDETRSLAGDAAVYARKGDVKAFARLLDRMLSDTERRAWMGRIGERRIRDELAWDHQKARYVRLVRELAGPGRGRSETPSGAEEMRQWTS